MLSQKEKAEQVLGVKLNAKQYKDLTSVSITFLGSIFCISRTEYLV